MDVLVREGARLPRPTHEHAEDLVADDHGGRDERARGALDGHGLACGVGIAEGWVGMRICRPARLALRKGAAAHPFPGSENDRARHGLGHVTPAHEDETVARRVPAVEAGGVALEDPERALRDDVQDLLEIERRGEAPGDVEEQGGVPLAALGLRPQTGIRDQVLELLAEKLELGDASPHDRAAAGLVVHEHDADRALLEAQRHHGEAAQPQERVLAQVRPQRRQGREIGIGQDHDRLARGPGLLEGAAPCDGQHPPPRSLRVAARGDDEGVLVGVGQQHADPVEVERLAGSADEGVDAPLDVHGAHHAHGERVQVLAHLAAILDVLEEARLGQGHRGVLGEGLHDLDLAGSERAARRAHEADDADRLAPDEERQSGGRDHPRLHEGGGERGVGRGRQARGQVVHQDRAPGGGNLPDHSLAEGELRRPTPLTPALLAGFRAQAQTVALERPELAGPARKERERRVHHRGQDGLGIEGGGERAAQARQGLEPVRVQRGLGVQAHVPNGHGGLRHEALEQLALVGSRMERGPTGDGEHGEERALEHDGHAEEAPEPARRPPVTEDEALVARHIRHVEALATLGDPAQGAFPVRHGRRGQALGHGLVRYRAPRDRVGDLVGDPEGDEGGAHHLGGGAGDGAQDLALVERGGDDLVDAGERPQPHGAPLEGVPQPRVIEQDAGLLADYLKRGELRGVEAPPPLPPDEMEGARDLAVEDDGDHEAGLVREALEGLRGETRVGGHVLRPHDLRVAEEPLGHRGLVERERRRAQRLHGVLGNSVSGDGPEEARSPIVEIGGHRLGAREPPELAADEPEGLGQIRGRADHAGDGQESRGLAQSGLEDFARRGRLRRRAGDGSGGLVTHRESWSV